MRDFSSHDAHAFSRFQFERLQTLSGTPFTLEACPAVDGQCVLVPCLDGLTAVSSTEGAGCIVKAGHHIWANAPFLLLFDCLIYLIRHFRPTILLLVSLYRNVTKTLTGNLFLKACIYYTNFQKVLSSMRIHL